MNRTIKDATDKRYFYETHDQPRTYLAEFVTAYNFAVAASSAGKTRTSLLPCPRHFVGNVFCRG
jgi:hypothetical protein